MLPTILLKADENLIVERYILYDNSLQLLYIALDVEQAQEGSITQARALKAVQEE